MGRCGSGGGGGGHCAAHGAGEGGGGVGRWGQLMVITGTHFLLHPGPPLQICHGHTVVDDVRQDDPALRACLAALQVLCHGVMAARMHDIMQAARQPEQQQHVLTAAVRHVLQRTSDSLAWAQLRQATGGSTQVDTGPCMHVWGGDPAALEAVLCIMHPLLRAMRWRRSTTLKLSVDYTLINSIRIWPGPIQVSRSR